MSTVQYSNVLLYILKASPTSAVTDLLNRSSLSHTRADSPERKDIWCLTVWLNRSWEIQGLTEFSRRIATLRLPRYTGQQRSIGPCELK